MKSGYAAPAGAPAPTRGAGRTPATPPSLRLRRFSKSILAFYEHVDGPDAIATFNDYFDAHFALGKELFREGKDEEALEALERARQINDRQDAVFYMFGLVMMKQRKFVIAEYAFREATRLNPNNVASRFYHGQALIEIALRESDQRQRALDLNTADQELTHAWETSEKHLNAVYLQRARLHELRGEKEAAARDLESFLKAEPEAKNAAAIREAIAKLRANK